MSRVTILVLGLTGIFLSGCLGGEEAYADEEDVGQARDALLDANALNLNALNLNALNLNALNLNALNINTLSPTSLAAIKKADSEGELARELLKYAVECALGPAQSFAFSWTDGEGNEHNEAYWGVLSLAPNWASNALSTFGAQWISACLASRVNWYGTPVTLSSRGFHPTLISLSSTEVADYPMVEGAFWGNLFGSQPHVYACFDAPNVNHSRLKKRDCAAGHVDGPNVVGCGLIEIVGPCQTACSPMLGPSGYFPACRALPGLPKQFTAITVWLEP